MKKILIIGAGGAGKSTMARKLGAVLNLPVHHLDKYFWKENWAETSKEEWIEVERGLVRQNAWVIDGNYSKSMETRIQAADTIIFLDFPKLVLIWRCIKRRFIYLNTTRPDMGGNNKEKLDIDFLKWILRYSREKVYERLKPYEGNKKVIVLHNSKEVKGFLKSLS